MRWIPNKDVYKAVMFALSMGYSDRKVNFASNYYHVNPDEVFPVVREEFWKRAKANITEFDRYHQVTLFHTDTQKLLGFSGKFVVFICPKCQRFVGASDWSREYDDIILSECPCGFVDSYQRNFVRKEEFKLKQEIEKAGGRINWIRQNYGETSASWAELLEQTRWEVTDGSDDDI